MNKPPSPHSPYQILQRVLLTASLLTFAGLQVSAYQIQYREEFWRLYHYQLYNEPIDIAGNIYWLESALQADFSNPLWALAKIENEREWEKYRYLFTMHLNLKLVELYLLWGSKYTKFEAYFYNYPWQRQNLDSLESAESLFNIALHYWEEARGWAERAGAFPWLYLTDIQYWEDEAYRIGNGELDYGEIIARHVSELERVRSEFLAMEENTY